MNVGEGKIARGLSGAGLPFRCRGIKNVPSLGENGLNLARFTEQRAFHITNSVAAADW